MNLMIRARCLGLLLAITLVLLQGTTVVKGLDFFNFFGDGQQGHGHHDHGHEHDSSDENSGALQSQSWKGDLGLLLLALIGCNGYLCKDQETCVSKAWECPCANELDVKCQLGQGSNLWFQCVRGDQSCESFGLKPFGK
jgi:hypothetical protein